ncbi:MAG: diguanylate cyclase [Coriobacteriia bacterium]|nr:diguanylate cyclase [Coriobacteriia bacterium]
MSGAVDIRRQRVVRGAWWALFGLLAVAEVAVWQLRLPIVTESLISQVLTFFLPMMLAAVASFWLAFRLSGLERRFWGLLGTAVVGILFSEAYFTWYTVSINFHGPQPPHWSEVGHLIAICVFYVLVVSMTELGESPIFARLRFYLDILSAAIVGFAVVYWFWTLPLLISVPRGGWAVASVMALYPVSAVAILLTTTLIALGWKAYHWRSWERLITFCFACYAVALFVSPWTYTSALLLTEPARTDWYGILLGFGLYLLLMAAVYRFTAAQDVELARPWPVPEVRPPWLPMLYPTALAAALVVMGVGALRVAGLPGGGAIVVATTLLALVLIVRSWLGSVELAHHRARSITDTISGAYNQRYLYERLPLELDDARSEHREIAAIAFDVIDFRDIVQMSGAEAGDQLLVELVDVIRAELPASATVYRVGRDEFVAVVDGLSALDAEASARRVNARLGSDVSVDGIPVAISAGVAVFPENAEDAASLVSRAIASQQLARSAERPDVVVYDAEIVEAADPLVRLDRSRRQSHRNKLRALAAAVDARDASTRFHSQAVAELVSAFALVLDLSEERTRVLESAALLHDIGKVGIADDVLLKVDPLTDEDWACIRAHCELGERLLAPAEVPEVLPIVRSHHERWDGTGYPDLLAGQDIPLEARVLAICDAFEAMTTGRRWQPALSTAAALEEIERFAGTRFDPELAETFERMVVRMHGRPIAGRLAAGRRDIGLAEQ